MNFENLEQMRYLNTKEVMESLTKIVADPTAKMEDRLKAAKIVDEMSDSLIKAYLLTRVTDFNEKTGDKLSKQLDRLVDKDG